ncbi:helix-turn-helix domain-containing protein [Paraburkholderia fungorum]|uniref:helix-turn-helix domain-containing protein n=1 Tax=Paraburkholderia fungorum TaxID=134537 RepID=UPI00402BEE65
MARDGDRRQDTAGHPALLPQRRSLSPATRSVTPDCAAVTGALCGWEGLMPRETGCLESLVCATQQITGFPLAGDVLGFDGISTGHHGQDAVALEDSSVCVIPFHLLESVGREYKGIQQYLHRLMGSEIVRESGQMLVLGTLSAEQRMAAFLLDLSARLRARGYCATQFNLRMTREEIGGYFGMQLDTVSRMLSKLGRDGIIDTDGKQIRILDPEGLRRV